MTKFSPEVKDRFLAAIERGATYELASGFAGITYQCYLNWMKKGEAQLNSDSDEKEVGDEYLEFYRNVKASEGKAAIKWLMQIDKAADIQWQAAAWKLERRYPQQYGKTVQEVQGKDGTPLYGNMPESEKLKRVDEILERARKRAAIAANSVDGERSE